MRKKKERKPCYSVTNLNTRVVSYLNSKGINILLKSATEAAKYEIDTETEYFMGKDGEYVAAANIKRNPTPKPANTGYVPKPKTTEE